MCHFAEMPEKPMFIGFLVDTINTTDKLTRYRKNNKVTCSEQPILIGQGYDR